jgi:hypothetical protein
MEKEVLRAMEGIDIYPIISLVMFFALFIAIVIYVIKADKSFMNKMSKLPLDNTDLTTYSTNEMKGDK